MAQKQTQGKGKRVIVVNVRKLTLLLITILMCVLALFSTFLAVRRFLKVQEYDVVGISRYDKEDLISASGVKKGDRLYLLDEKEIEERILAACPYLASVKVQKSFPNTLRIETVAKEAQWYLDIGGAKYSLDGEMRVIAEVIDTDGITKLTLPHVQSAMYGEVPNFGESENETRRTLEVLDVIRHSALRDRLTEVDLESRWDIRVTVEDRFQVTLGDATDLEAKLKKAEAILREVTASSGSLVISKGVGGYEGAFLPDTEENSNS